MEEHEYPDYKRKIFTETLMDECLEQLKQGHGHYLDEKDLGVILRAVIEVLDRRFQVLEDRL